MGPRLRRSSARRCSARARPPTRYAYDHLGFCIRPGLASALDERPAARNLVGLYAALQGLEMEEACVLTEGMQFSALKGVLTELLVNEIVPVGNRMREYLADPGYLDLVLGRGAEQASRIASDTMRVVRDIVGLAP